MAIGYCQNTYDVTPKCYAFSNGFLIQRRNKGLELYIDILLCFESEIKVSVTRIHGTPPQKLNYAHAYIVYFPLPEKNLGTRL